MIAWTVALAAYERDEKFNYEQLALGGSDGRALLVQRSLEHDEQDVELGHDTYCLVDQFQNTVYGGVAGWRLDDDELTLHLDEPAADVFGGDGFVLALAPDVPRELIRTSLDRLLG